MADLTDLQADFERIECQWKHAGKWQAPDLQDAAAFLVTEAAEVLSDALRLKDYTRNNARLPDIGAELADVLLMTIITAREAEIDLEAAFYAKLAVMDKKRK